MSLICLLQEPRRPSTRPELVANGIVGTEIFIAGQTRDIVETIYEIGGEGQKFFHFLKSYYLGGGEHCSTLHDFLGRAVGMLADVDAAG